MNPDWEYAMLATAAGVPIVRTEALRSFEKFQAALAANGGHAPRDAAGRVMLWGEHRGWHPQAESRSASPSASPSSGAGWRVLDSPRIPNADLQRLAEGLWARACPWSCFSPWRARFGVLEGEHARAIAMCIYTNKLIVIDERKLFDRAAEVENELHRDGDFFDAELCESLLHEFTHIARGPEADSHDPRFHLTLAEMRARAPRLGIWR